MKAYAVAVLVGVTALMPAAHAQAPQLSQAQARAAVVKAKAEMWKDDRSIRDATAGAPYACDDNRVITTGLVPKAVSIPATCMCIRVNAKNSMGGYTGLQTMSAVFSEISPDGRLRFLMADGAAKCGPMTPFPELNGK